jgi:hypothetical protein
MGQASAWEKVGNLVEEIKADPGLERVFAEGTGPEKIEALRAMGFEVEDIQALTEGAELLSPKATIGPGWWMW